MPKTKLLYTVVQGDETRTSNFVSYQFNKGKAIPVQAWTGPEGSRWLRLPFQDILHTNVEKMSALRTSCLYPPGNIQVQNQLKTCLYK